MLEIQVPASTSNLGAGFDCFGLALKLYLTVEIQTRDRRGVEIALNGEGAADLPTGNSNLIYRAFSRLYQELGQKPPGVRLRVVNEIPLFRGLGSSGAATVAGLLGAAELAAASVSTQDLLRLATELEGHPENAAASLLGGLTLNCVEGKNVLCQKITVDESLRAVVLVPQARVPTHEARRVLPKQVPHADAVFNLQRSAFLAHAFTTRNYAHVRTAMQDRLHQPYRKALLPEYDAFERSGYDFGALGVCVSGSGSTILALTERDRAERVRAGWQEQARKLGIAAEARTLEMDNQGAQVRTRG